MVSGVQDHEVMTLAEVSQYLQLAEKTVLRMAQRSEIPAAKVASQWRFLRPVIRDWLAGQMHSMPEVKLDAIANLQPRSLPLHEVVRPELITLNVLPGPKEQVLRQLMEPIQKTGFAANPSLLLDSLVERERMMTTAVGHGIAIPHPRKPLTDMFPEPAIALGICREGVDFDAIDDQRVHLFFLICATREAIHLELMAKVAWFSRRPERMQALMTASSKKKVESALL
jgi:excisionase family DNA binding protein